MHDFARAHQKLAKQPRWNVGAHADLFRQHAILFGALYQRREYIVRQVGVPVVRDRAGHLPITAFDKSVGECLVDR